MLQPVRHATSVPSPSGALCQERILSYLRTLHEGAWSLVVEGRQTAARPSTQDLNDIIYTLHFLGWPVVPDREGGAALVRHLSAQRLAGGLNGDPSQDRLSVHNTAYVLGALSLLRARGLDLFDQVLTPVQWRLAELVDPTSHCPKWPRAWSHHSWRVSHWIGGAASIVLALGREMPKAPAPSPLAVAEAADQLIDEESGMLKCYRSRLLQSLFRQLYRLRHDPTLGDVGGVVHLHWVNYALGRPFKGGRALFDTARRCLLTRRPFMEAVPFCLDFDIVQIVRTAMPDDLGQEEREAVSRRAEQFAADIFAFLDEGLRPDYPLHKLPGALATLHECASISDAVDLSDLGLAPKDPPQDIMRAVAWL